MVAAAGASVLSAVVVNPLDVVKVRMQARAANAAAPSSRSFHAYCWSSIPVRSIQNSSRKFLVGSAASSTTLAQHPVLQEMIASCLGRSGAPGAAAAGALRPHNAHCLCAAAAGGGALNLPEGYGNNGGPAAGAHAGSQLWRWHGGQHAGALRAAGGTAAAAELAAGSGMLGTLQGIIRQEGAVSLWRGLDSALLMSVPTVLMYYPLYDHLLHTLSSGSSSTPSAQQQQNQQQWSLGAAAPVVAGASARTVTVMAVAPLEYIRTLQQAGGVSGGAAGGATSHSAAAGAAAAGGRMSTWQALRRSLALEAGGAGAGGVLRALPRLWTGLSATIARDVPFSAVYWGLVEPIRGSILSSSTSLTRLASAPTAPAASPGTSTSTMMASASPDALPGRALSSHDDHGMATGSGSEGGIAFNQLPWAGRAGQEQDDWALALDPAPQAPSAAAATPTPSVGAFAGRDSAADASPTALEAAATGDAPAAQQPTHAQLVLANVLAGSLAGAMASALTTPFDVVKTRMQLSPSSSAAARAGAGGAPGMLGVMRQVVRQQGVRGLFVGVGPRAARCAPACAIVLFSYELLKRTLADQQQ